MSDTTTDFMDFSNDGTSYSLTFTIDGDSPYGTIAAISGSVGGESVTGLNFYHDLYPNFSGSTHNQIASGGLITGWGISFQLADGEDVALFESHPSVGQYVYTFFTSNGINDQVFDLTFSYQETSSASSNTDLATEIAADASAAGSATNAGTYTIDISNNLAVTSSIQLSSGETLDFAVSQGAVLDISASIAGSTALQIDGGGTVELDSASSNFSGSIVIDDGTLILGAPGAAGTAAIVFNNPTVVDPGIQSTIANAANLPGITNFGAGDFIDLTDLNATGITKTFAPNGTGGGVLTLNGTQTGSGDPESVSFTFTNYTGPFYTYSDNNGGTQVVTVPCYGTGTSILTTEGETPVESLHIGDEIITASGTPRAIKWIGCRAYVPHFANANPKLLPICFKAGALGNNLPRRDLYVSANHAMFIDNALIPAELLVNNATILKTTRIDAPLAYWHIELETHDILLAEGAPSETYVDDNTRDIFHNAQEYWAEHPEDIGKPAIYCAPRLESGYLLAAIRDRLAEIAGIAKPQSAGALSGTFAVTGTTISGWAKNGLYPNAPVCLDIFANGTLIAQTLANRPHPEAGLHGFETTLPATTTENIEVKRSLDGAPLHAALPLSIAA